MPKLSSWVEETPSEPVDILYVKQGEFQGIWPLRQRTLIITRDKSLVARLHWPKPLAAELIVGGVTWKTVSASMSAMSIQMQSGEKVARIAILGNPHDPIFNLQVPHGNFAVKPHQGAMAMFDEADVLMFRIIPAWRDSEIKKGILKTLDVRDSRTGMEFLSVSFCLLTMAETLLAIRPRS